MKLAEYIAENYESKAAFARAIDVEPTHVHQMIRADMQVFNGELFSKRRVLPIVKKCECDK